MTTEKFIVTVDKPVEQEIEVSFPLYLHCSDIFDTGTHYDAWTRVDRDGSTYSVTLTVDRGGRTEWEFRTEDENKRSLAASVGYWLIKRKYEYEQVAPEVFYAKAEEMRAAIDEIPGIEDFRRRR